MADIFDIRQRRERLLADVRQLPPGTQALERLALLREGFDCQFDEYVNVLNILSDTTYEDRKHFLLELIQNADDAQFTGNEAEITFTILEDGLELHYNEEGFTVEDVIAITGAGISTKTGKNRLSHSFIGEKGIGFKSVFALASSVEIESPPWHFLLRKDKLIVPEVLNTGRMKNGGGTRLRLRFSDSSVLNTVADELYRYVRGQVEAFLFLQRLASFRVVDQRQNPPYVRGLTLLPSDRSEDKLLLTTFPDYMVREYVLYKEEVEFPAELVAERWERLGQVGPLKRQLVVAALVDSTEECSPEGRLFCFLPTDVTVPVPLFIQVDGHTKADRGQLHDPVNNKWNRYLLNLMPGFILRALLAWRGRHEIACQLPTFIPVSEGSGQLAPVFKELKTLLKTANWIRTFDESAECWTSPEKAVIATDFWVRWFMAYPDFREKAEKLLDKIFVHPGWAANPKWKDKLNDYGVREINEIQIVTILEVLKLPKEMLEQNQNLIELYRQILNLPSLREKTIQARTWYKLNNQESLNSVEIKKRLHRASIYPFKGKRFGPLKSGDETTKVFWLSGSSSRRSTGLEGTVDYWIIDNNYTYDPKIDEDATPEKKAKMVVIKERNEIVRKLLDQLGVKELCDENIISELQLPWLLKQDRGEANNTTLRFEVLRAIFDNYRLKRNLEDEYKKQLSRLSEAFFPAESGALYRLKEMVLPKALCLEPIDYLYGKNELENLGLPAAFLEPPPSKAKQVKLHEEQERKKKLREEWRSFLIHCGIKNAPEFIVEKKPYNNYWEFEYDCELYCNIWIKKISRCTKNRYIEFLKTLIDEGTRNLLMMDIDSESRRLLAKELYKAWWNTFNHELNWHKASYYYDRLSMPTPGYFLVKYIYRQRYTTRVEDPFWGGIDREKVPLKTINDDIVSPSVALRVTPSQEKQLKYAKAVLPLVLEDERGTSGYHPIYLDSLEVRAPKITDLNLLWDKLGEKNFPDIIKVAVEFLKLDISGAGLELYDKEADRLRPASDFRLGREGTKGVPLIERQYGELGRELGELLRLPEENEVSSYLEFFENILSIWPDPIDDLLGDLYRLLKYWQDWDVGSRGLIANSLRDALDKRGLRSSPVMVLNDNAKLNALRDSGIIAFGLNIEDTEKYALEKSAKEIGLILPEEVGRLEVSSEKPLEEHELKKFNLLLQGYIGSLEVHEKSRLASHLSGLGGFEFIGKKVFRAEIVTRVFGQDDRGRLLIQLPYLDTQNRRFYVTSWDKPEEILAKLLSECGFTRFKSALLEIKEIMQRLREEVHPPRLADKRAEDRDIGVKHAFGVKTGGMTDVGSVGGVETRTNKSLGQSVEMNSKGSIVLGEKSGASGKCVETGLSSISGERTFISSVSGSLGDFNKRADTQTGTAVPDGAILEVTGESVANVATLIKERLTDNRPAPFTAASRDGWNTGLGPDEEAELREKIGSKMLESLKEGPDIYEKKLRKSGLKASKSLLTENLKVVDPGAVDPKAFLEAEYGGRCQVCATELRLCSGRKWFEVFHIFNPGGAWWADRPFNILSLCPNCHALAKHGGRAMFNIYRKAQEVVQQTFFPIEVERFQGDFYVVSISINGRDEKLVISKVHMSYFVELFKAGEEVMAVNLI